MTESKPLKLAPAQQTAPVEQPAAAPPPAAQPAPARKKRRWKLRHYLILLSFLLFVVAPGATGSYLLFTNTADQYHSKAAFAVRSEDFANPLDALSAFTQVGASSASDSVILYDFIRSQPLIEKVDRELDLEKIYNRQSDDLIFALGTQPTIEDIIDYWDRMITVAVDSGTGVIDLEVRAFLPEDAQAIAYAILRASSDLVNDLSRIAREDAMRFALEDVSLVEDRLKALRQKIRDFRVENQIINPEADVESQMGVVSALQSELAAALVERETIRSYSDGSDPRIANLDRRIVAIRNQIASERDAVSGETQGDRALSTVIGEYEELLVDLEFAQNAYTAALAGEEQARAEARRQSRYIAVHIAPTMAEESIYPKRFLLAGLLFVGLLAGWAILVLMYYNVRDRS